MEFQQWFEQYQERMTERFAGRLVCLGLQGSRARGEAVEDSDIDVVAVLDALSMDDLKAYGALLDGLPDREKVCGFICGREELLHWEKADLLQLVLDTKPVLGTLDFAMRRIHREDVCRAVQMAACNLYHGTVHNLLHGKDMSALRELYKAAFFLIRSLHYAETGEYLHSCAELIERRDGEERRALEIGRQLKAGTAPETLEALSERLIRLSSQCMRKYGGNV